MGVLSWSGGLSTDIIGFREGDNLFINPSFNINQRNVSGTVTLAAYAFGHDGLQAGGNGATYTFALAANGIDTVITLTAGQLVMPVMAELIDGSALCFVFSGTAGFRIATGQTVQQAGATSSTTSWFSASQGQRPTGYTFTPGANTQVNIMFGDPANANNSVTFTTPQLERVIQGVTPTRFQRRSPAVELIMCQRYYLPSVLNPTQTFLSGTSGNTGPSGTYTTPAGVAWLRIRMVGGGGGGAGSGTSPGAAAAGTATTFGSLSVNGGAAGNGAVGANQTSKGTTGDFDLPGNSGADGMTGVAGLVFPGGFGGASSMGGGAMSRANGAGRNGLTNAGSGGGGGGGSGAVTAGGGGASGAYCEKIIQAPAASYSYVVGSGGSGGTAGTSGNAGGQGAIGLIIIEEHYLA